ncbi:MAG: 16S rRNA processing protein RimM [Deltaproteobacteria bacterium HGW-Deltaproteobacteria-8]|jgi:16S rRNA processing protein RimM|nr:MAG: 16S rRNA processing protein RimM [Deltaproteobacteria bacterium HGW-Deltaproteobacteria-8]
MTAKPERAAAHGMVAVAHVAKPHGIRGELCMDIHAGSPLLFAPGRTLFLAVPNLKGGGLARPKPFEIAASRQHTGRMLVTLTGVPDRTAADLLRGAEVYIAEADLPPPDEGEEYLFRLLGSKVFLPDVGEAAGAEIGVFEAILDTPGQITWVIRGKGGEEILFPAVPQFILGLDAKRKEIVIDPPPGLLELYLAKPE